MKKILFLLNNMNIGGTEKSFLNLLDMMSPEQYDVTLLLLEESGGFMDFIPSWVQVKTMPGYPAMRGEILEPPLRIVIQYLREHKIIRAICLAFYHVLFKITDDRTLYFRYVLKDKGRLEEAYDAAVAYAGPFDFLTVYVLYNVQAEKKFQWIHFDVRKIHFNTKMCRKLYPRFDRIITVSDDARKALLKEIPEISPKTITALNTVSTKQCRLLADMGHGFEDTYEGIRIVTVGRLAQEKGQDIIPEVAAKLKTQQIRFKWYLVGDGKMKPEIEQKCIEYGVSDDVVFLGTTPNPYPYLKQADLYVQTSIHEGFCISLAEAKVFDLPIISTDCAGAHEQLDGLARCHIVKRLVPDICSAILEEVNRNKSIVS
ncbi:MAG: glycosyltransferase [Eubacteriales bacterium]|nr:glycosyltransferase [Eubacteriales bacterium]